MNLDPEHGYIKRTVFIILESMHVSTLQSDGELTGSGDIVNPCGEIDIRSAVEAGGLAE
ncbi:MAG: hypothetical protein GQ565_11965 [Candidatus Aegiribacteria sp.]|nr:hypothetical protein [Candidatus Aegiribacteria sp.]